MNPDSGTLVHKILFCAVDRADACGGPYSWARHFPRAMKAAGIEVAVLILCRGGLKNSSVAKSLVEASIEVNVLDPDDLPYTEDQAKWFVGQVDRYRPTVFIANLVLPALYACRWIRKRGVRTVGVVHSDPAHDPFYHEMLVHFGRNEGMFCLDQLVCVSTSISESAVKEYRANVPVSTISCGTAVGNARVARNDDQLRLLYAGRLTQEQKGIRELTEAFLAATTLPGVSASICGDGPERGWLEERLHGQNRVSFLGNVAPEQMNTVICDHHVIVLLSDYEGLPMALVEGMACGLVPIVLDRPGGVREVVEHGVNGLLVRDRGGDFLAAVQRLIERDTWSRFSVEAVATVTQRYGHQVVFDSWASLIRELSQSTGFSPARSDRISLSACREWFSNHQMVKPTRFMTVKSGLAREVLSLRSRLKLGTKYRSLASRVQRWFS